MNEFRNNIERFIMLRCGEFMASSAEAYINAHKEELKIIDSQGTYPPYVFVEFMELDSCDRAYILDDTFHYNVSAHCKVQLSDYMQVYESIEDVHLRIFCCACFEDSRLESIRIERIDPFLDGRPLAIDGAVKADGNLIPEVYTAQLDDEASAFLRRYCPDALKRPMRVPIEKIVTEDMGLKIEKRYCLSLQGNVLGGIVFSDCAQHLYDDFFAQQSKAVKLKRGTVILDFKNWFNSPEGRTNNTLAHEAYHWFRHRVYAAIKSELDNEPLVAHRCPEETAYKRREGSWPENDRIEWQANHVAPRILMPTRTFRQKANEVCKAHGYVRGKSDIAILGEIAIILADFFAVSKQSVCIRLQEIGYSEAKQLNPPQTVMPDTTIHIDPTSAFEEYKRNAEFRKMVDSGMFCHIDGFYIINDEKYVTQLKNGEYSMTDYAIQHLDECALVFEFGQIDPLSGCELQNGILYRDSAGTKLTAKYSAEESDAVVQQAKKLEELRQRFDKMKADHPKPQTFWEAANQYMESRHWNKIVFEDMTGLGDSLYRDGHNHPEKAVSFQTAISVCAGLGLDLPTSNRLLGLAGYNLNDSDEHLAYQFVLSDMRFDSLEDKNAFLADHNVQTLGSKPYRP